MSPDPRFRTIDGIIASVETYARPSANRADYLFKEAKLIVDAIKADMTAEEVTSYDTWSAHVENNKNRSPMQYVEAADQLWQFAVWTYRSVLSRRHDSVQSSRAHRRTGAQPLMPSSRQGQQAQVSQARPAAQLPQPVVGWVPGLIPGWAPVHPQYFPFYYHRAYRRRGIQK